MMTSSGIRVESFVRGKNGELIKFEDLTEKQREKAATELKLRYLNTLYAGVATFYPAEDDPPK